MKFCLTALLILSLPAQASDTLSGKFTDDHGGKHSIGSLMWTMKGTGKTSSFHILEEKSGHILARNDGTNPFHPNLFSRFDFVKQKDGTIAFCQTVPDAKTRAEAGKHPPADYRAEDGKGCGGFPFSVLKAEAKAQPAAIEEEGGITSGE